jgi:hypothetical protein
VTIHGMAHEEVLESLEALALDALDALERDAVLAHLEGCASCRDTLRSLRATAAELAYAVAPVPMASAPRDRVREHLVERAAADQGHHAHVRVTPSSSPALLIPNVIPYHPGHHHRRGYGGIPTSWIATAASIIAIASVASLILVRRERDDLETTLRLASADHLANSIVADSLRGALRDRDRLIANVTGPQVAIMALASKDARIHSARIFWDQSTNAWTFVAHNLPAPRTGRTYQLWLVTPKSKISAGTFAPNPDGNAVVRATYPLPRDALAAVSVTEEPAAGSLQPTSAPIIVGMRGTR